MRVPRPVILFCVFAFAPLFSAAQQSPAVSSPYAIQLLQGALATLTKGTALQDVTLTGTAQRIAGSRDETGTATLQAIIGASRMDLSLSGGPRSEVVNTLAQPAGTWSGPDSVSHAISYHNLLLVDPAWFFPAFPISRGLATGYAAKYIGQETRNAQAVQHITISQVSPLQTPDAPNLAQLSQMDFFLDSITLLPAAIALNIHPDNDAGLDIPIEVRFSGYRSVNGAQIPFHVQKFLNNGLILDLQFQSATLNSGLSATIFQIQ